MPTILLVEDNSMNRDMLSRRISRRGFEIITATNGAEAVAVAQDKQPDLILMDMSLPLVNGWDATRQIKEDPQTMAIPVIALTAHTLASDRERSLEAGCDAYITKPIDFSKLLVKIEHLLDSHQK